jgi:D-glucuronyl C5-epimerase C-terminus
VQRRVQARRPAGPSIGRVRWTAIAGTALTLICLAVPAAASARSAPAPPGSFELGQPRAPLAHLAQAPPAKPAVGPPGSFSDALGRLLAAGSISPATEQADLATMIAARQSLGRLTGTRHTELAAVIDNITQISTAGMLTPSRLPALVLTLQRNRQWWTTGPLLSFEERVAFPGSLLVWEYYPGQGLEIQWLASFGKANGYFLTGPADDAQLGQLLDQLVSLAVQRAGGIAWEYDFDFDGGTPPWVSAISQGTAIQALSRAAVRLDRPDYFTDASNALTIFETPPPLGVRLATPEGAWYLIYSFAPQELVLNAFIQSLVGLYDFATLADDPTGRALFAAGNDEAETAVPHYDTGAWSLYDQSTESDLSYHELLTGFLQNLCNRTENPAPSIAPLLAPAAPAAPAPTAPPSTPVGAPTAQPSPAATTAGGEAAPRAARLLGVTPASGAGSAPTGGTAPTPTPSPTPTPAPAPTPTPPAPAPAPAPAANIYCTTAADFTADLHQPPKLALALTGTVRAGQTTQVRLTLSKISDITMSAVRSGHTVSSSGEQLGHGTQLLAWTPAAAGRYTITVGATDLAGNSARTSLVVTVAPAPAAHAKRRPAAGHPHDA